ncbi:helix-turn-helix domain-containing protein (plasmid) [Novosphingobium sp. EMRT-2]|nr:helix-turn-helix domain-containing protein [Novosphingobium sp. EMRT-2]
MPAFDRWDLRVIPFPGRNREKREYPVEELLHVKTADAPIGQRCNFWTGQVAAHLSNMRIDVRRKLDFNASISIRSLGPARIALIDADFQAISHRADGSENRFHLNLVQEGGMVLHRFGERIELSAGDWCLIDERESYDFTTSERCSCIVMQMPVPWAKRIIPDPGKPLIASSTCENHWTTALSHGLLAVGAREIRYNAVEDGMVADQLANLLSLALGPRSDMVTGRHKTALLRSIRQVMSERFTENSLTARDVAAASRISLRYLHQLFATQNTSFGQQLLALRLHRAEQMLADRRLAKVSISEIAHAVGFADSSTLTRHFRLHLGLTPRDYRKSRV